MKKNYFKIRFIGVLIGAIGIIIAVFIRSLALAMPSLFIFTVCVKELIFPEEPKNRKP